MNTSLEGLLLIDKPSGITSFQVVSKIKQILLGRNKVGHSGTLDPMASGLLIILIGRNYTKNFHNLLKHKKQYLATIRLGFSTTTYDHTGSMVYSYNGPEPSIDDINQVIQESFLGKVKQEVPIFSAKKVDGACLYKLAHKNVNTNNLPFKLPIIEVELHINILSYTYPYLEIEVTCSSGTYIRSIAHMLGNKLGCYGHTSKIHRTSIGPFSINNALSTQILFDQPEDNILMQLQNRLIKPCG